MDKEYVLMNEIVKNENITQRELSRKVELSLGSVNILLNKMIRDGLLKIKQIPLNRVAYMLTPSGIAEKVKKTSGYIKYHYNYISETMEKIKVVLRDLITQYPHLFIVIDHDEIGELVKLAVDEMDMKASVEVVDGIQKENPGIKEGDDRLIVAASIEAFDELAKWHGTVINLLEHI